MPTQGYDRRTALSGAPKKAKAKAKAKVVEAPVEEVAAPVGVVPTDDLILDSEQDDLSDLDAGGDDL